MSPTVSIVITSYNHKNYLREALDSVLNQTVRPLEVLVSDDGSSDGSIELAQAYAQRYPGLVVPLIHENVGIPRNRNIALREVRGDFVGILDGDDVFYPRKIERQLSALEDNRDLDGVYSNFMVVDDDGNQLRRRYNQPQPSGNVLFNVANLNFGLMRTMLARTDRVRDAGLMDPTLPKYDGLWLSIQLAATGKIAYIDEVLVGKRAHPGGDSQKQMHQDIIDLSEIYRRVRALASNLSAEERKALDKAWQTKIATLESRTAQ